MIEFQFINTISLSVISVVGICLAGWIYLSNRRSKINQLFFFITFFILSWINLVYFASVSTSRPVAILLSKLAFIPVYLFLVTTYFFTVFFPRKIKRFLVLDLIVMAGIIFLFFITLFTNLHVKNVVFKQWGVSPILGEGKIFVYSVIFLIAILFSGILFKKYFILPKKEKLKIQYFLIGFFIFVVMNIIFNVLLAPRYTDFPYYLIGNYSAIFLLGFTAYAIVKRELFDVRVVLTTILVVSIGILLLLDVLVFTEELLFRIIKGGTLIVFLFFGYLLIRSVLREIYYREELRKAYKKLKKLDRAKSRFLSMASHQLRAPLTVIKGYISMILEGVYGEIDETVKEKLKRSYQSNERLTTLVNDLLNKRIKYSG